MRKRAARWVKRDLTDLAADIRVPDESVPGDEVCELCPCHVGWEKFEENVSAVLHHLRAGTRVVKAQALHVYDDASRIEARYDLAYWLEPGEERIGERRARGLRSIEQRLEAIKNNKIRRNKRKGRFQKLDVRS